jgi:Domain of unknown function (DUF4111)/Nucleotidyltransferase domain
MNPGVEQLLARLVDGQAQALGDSLVGTYVFGSVVTGGFDPGISDIDTVAVLRSDLTAAHLASLERLHRDIVEQLPGWEDRVEVVYLSAQALATFRTASSPAARISPGESFHAIDVDHRWLIDWYQLREVGVALCGPPAASLVPFIAHDEYVEAVRQHMLAWPDWVGGLETRGAQAYAILTMCRGLRTWRTGEHVSKREAARWACVALPEHAPLIQDALVWRERSRIGPRIDGTARRDDTRRFVNDVKRLVEEGHDEPR